MAESCRSWWQNCGCQPDAEIREIDRMEDELAPLPENVAKIRGLISTLELCHHKAGRWVQNIARAIGQGETDKGLGTRPADRHHAAEDVWQNACAALSAWCAGCPGGSVDLVVDDVPAAQLLARLGQRSPLREWQVQRVIERIRSAIHWPRSSDDPTAQYVWILLGGGEYESAYQSRCPEHYREHEDFWLATVRTIIHDTENGDRAALSLGIAIDMLSPCHWRFVKNLEIVLAAIGGELNPAQPFAACGRNIALLPMADRMRTVCDTLKVFCGGAESGKESDRPMLALLGESTAAKRWLAASLSKTITLQLSPPAELRALSALAGPDWIYG